MKNSDQRPSNFIAIDGDDIGIRLRSYIVSNDISGAANYSENLNAYFKDLAKLMSDLGCQIVFCGGDSILAFANSDTLQKLIETITSPAYPMSIGVGRTAEVAYLALQLAKARGKSQVVIIDNIEANTVKVWKQELHQPQ